MLKADIAFDAGSDRVVDSVVYADRDISEGDPRPATLRPPLPIRQALRGGPFDHRNRFVHLAPEGGATGVEIGPRLP